MIRRVGGICVFAAFLGLCPSPASIAQQQPFGCLSPFGTITGMQQGMLTFSDGRTFGLGTSFNAGVLNAWKVGDPIGQCAPYGVNATYPDTIVNYRNGAWANGVFRAPVRSTETTVLAASTTTTRYVPPTVVDVVPVSVATTAMATTSSTQSVQSALPTVASSTTVTTAATPTTTPITTTSVRVSTTAERAPTVPQVSVSGTTTSLAPPAAKFPGNTEFCVINSPSGYVTLHKMPKPSLGKNLILKRYNGECDVWIATLKPAQKGAFTRARVGNSSGWLRTEWLVRSNSIPGDQQPSLGSQVAPQTTRKVTPSIASTSEAPLMTMPPVYTSKGTNPPATSTTTRPTTPTTRPTSSPTIGYEPISEAQIRDYVDRWRRTWKTYQDKYLNRYTGSRSTILSFLTSCDDYQTPQDAWYAYDIYNYVGGYGVDFKTAEAEFMRTCAANIAEYKSLFER